MTPPPAGKPGFRVGIAGASSLLGQEIIRVLRERNFPVSRLAKFDASAAEADLPVLDLSEAAEFDELGTAGDAGGLDLLILAARARTKAGESELVGQALQAAGLEGESSISPSCLIIDAADALANVPGRKISIPSCAQAASPATLGAILVSPHPASIVLVRILSSLAGRFSIENCVAEVLLPASELGPRGIEELQKQTVSLLSFQKFPEKVFGGQLAFNLLSRLSGKSANEIASIENTIRQELRESLGTSVQLPAMHFCHAPVFYSLAFSIFIRLKEKPSRETLTSVLTGNGMTVRPRGEAAPSPVEAAGRGEILLDAIAADPDIAGGYWMWAAVDNIKLAAENAVDIARLHLLRSQGMKQ